MLNYIFIFHLFLPNYWFSSHSRNNFRSHIICKRIWYSLRDLYCCHVKMGSLNSFLKKNLPKGMKQSYNSDFLFKRTCFYHCNPSPIWIFFSILTISASTQKLKACLTASSSSLFKPLLAFWSTALFTSFHLLKNTLNLYHPQLSKDLLDRSGPSDKGGKSSGYDGGRWAVPKAGGV